MSFEINKNNTYELCIITIIVGTPNISGRILPFHCFFALQANLLIQTISRKTYRFWVHGGKMSTMTIILCNYISTYIKTQSQNYSRHWNSAATVWEMKEYVLSPVNWRSDMMVRKGQYITNISHHYLVLGLLQPSKMQFATLSSTGYRKSTMF